MRGLLDSILKFKVIDDSPLGKACVAISEIKAGEIICKMLGPQITLREFSEKYQLNDCNPLQIGEEHFLDLIEPYVFFNHSCAPNAGIRNNGVLFALSEIKAGEEIMYDYSTTVDDVWWSMDCLCGQKNCRRKISDFQSIPHDFKEFYLDKGALTSHIISTYY